MSKPPPQENLPDELIEAYRRASANDRSRPSERVRESILARSKHVVTSRNNAAERPFASATPAANESRWKWRAAASLAAVGLAGLLAVQTLVTAPHGAPPTHPDATTEKAPRVAEVAPPATAPSNSAAVSAPPPAAAANPVARDRIRPSVGNEANAPRSVAPTLPMDAAAPQQKIAGPALSGAGASRAEALTARLQSPMNTMAARTASPVSSPRREQAIAALHATFPDLFAGPAMAGTVRIALVLNSDGTVYKIAREDAAAAGADASLQLRQALGIGPDELETPAEIIALDRTAEQPNAIAVAFGVRRSNPEPARDAR